MHQVLHSACSGSPFVTLPDGVISIVLAALFSADDVERTVKARTRSNLPDEVLDFASVCKAWKRLVHEIASAGALSCFRISLKEPTRQAVLQLRRQLILRRRRTQRVAVERIPCVDQLHGVAIWRSILSHAPHTQLLDLTKIERQSRTFVKPFLTAAGWQLPRVNTLHLPMYKVGVEFSDWMYQMIEAVMETLELWFHCGEIGGLRVLRASLCDFTCKRETTTRLFETLATCCPNLERLETNQGVFGGVCTEQWALDIDSWTQFCKACTSLKEFDWLRVPFATSFFEIFGRHTQSQLTKLTLRTAVNWDWDYYFSESLPTHPKSLEESGYGGSATNVSSVLKSCPNLRELDVEWPAPLPSGVSKMDPEVFGDEFYEQLAVCCPRLERVSGLCISSDRREEHTIQAFTDRSLKAVATLPQLQIVEVSAKNITGDAVYDLVVNPATPQAWMNREYRILVGDADPEAHNPTFYAILERFLERLHAEDCPLVIASRPVSLWLVNNSSRTAGNEWYTGYVLQLRRLVARIQTKHPTVSMTIALVQEEDGWAHQVASFGFHTPHGKTLEWERGSFLHQQGNYADTALDQVFVRRFRNEYCEDDDDEETLQN